ncbi:MAG: CHAT domain-containing protein [Lachnospiraceae bacterium]|nr:CHAT domain-containing protein [Lachnospiraceae bacterium]
MISATDIANYLNLAQKEYRQGSPVKAITYTEAVLEYYKSISITPYPSQENMTFLDALTLHQTFLSLLHKPDEFLQLEEDIKQLIFLLFAERAPFYYSLHLFDVCEHLAVNHYLTEARMYKMLALNTIKEQFGDHPYVSFMAAIFDAQIAFYMEDYYSCIDAASLANTLWYTPEYGQVFPPFMEKTPTAEQGIDHVGTNNMLLLCNAYGKINNPKDSITVLEDTLRQGAFDYYQTISAEITLAELYLLNQQREEALNIYEKYKASEWANYPDLTAALASLAFVLESQPSAFTKALTSNQYCCSHDAFVISRYNYALSLTYAGKYEEALSQFQAIGNKGYSMSLAILSHLNRSEDIQALANKANAYLYRQIEQIIAHYEERLAYNHLSRLQYHIDFCLGAYCNYLSAEEAYTFLLNTKYIALEASALSQAGKDVSSSNHRELYQAKQVMSLLPENTQLLEFTQTRSLSTVSYGVFLVSSDNISYVPLGDATFINELLKNWHSLLQESAHIFAENHNRTLLELQKTDSKLRKALFLPLKTHFTPSSHLLVAPAGALVNFPFSRLSVSANEYLGDKCCISYLNSGKELCKPEHTHNPSPAFEQNTSLTSNDRAFVIGNPTVRNYPSLLWAEREAELAAFYLHANACKNEDASLSNFLDATKSAPCVLHIAAHGIYKEPGQDTNWDSLYECMTQSGILLADNELLSCAQISKLDLSETKLAILSCCHSAHASYQATEGSYGLRRAFHMAGCKILIANLWQIDDAISFLWMKSFYEALAICSATVEEAFATAVETVRKQEPNPYYWAGFVLIY